MLIQANTSMHWAISGGLLPLRAIIAAAYCLLYSYKKYGMHFGVSEVESLANGSVALLRLSMLPARATLDIAYVLNTHRVDCIRKATTSQCHMFHCADGAV